LFELFSSECDSPLPAAEVKVAEVEVAPVIKASVRQVRFYGSVSLILIPSIREYKEAGIVDALWWGPADYSGFRKAATSALRKFMHQYKLVDKRKALRLFILESSRLDAVDTSI
jgi:hypothetical protein